MKPIISLPFLLSLLLPALAQVHKDHFYTTDPTGEAAPSLGYRLEEITGYVFNSATPSIPNCPSPFYCPYSAYCKSVDEDLIPIYRWYQQTTRDHFYTANKTGELAPSLGYNYEGIAWYMFGKEESGTVALYRYFHAPGFPDHFYTTSKAEGDGAAGYVPEGVTGYLYPQPRDGTVPVYRWYLDG